MNINPKESEQPNHEAQEKLDVIKKLGRTSFQYGFHQKAPVSPDSLRILRVPEAKNLFVIYIEDKPPKMEFTDGIFHLSCDTGEKQINISVAPILPGAKVNCAGGLVYNMELSVIYGNPLHPRARSGYWSEPVLGKMIYSGNQNLPADSVVIYAGISAILSPELRSGGAVFLRRPVKSG
jgi:hypothetical protein